MTYVLSLLLGVFTVVELNCENLFDCQHDSLKHDEQFLPTSDYHWTSHRYWTKVNRIGQTILSCGESANGWSLPDMVGLCEVENDSCLIALTRRSLLRHARYEYVMTHSPDERGIDVALLYSPFSFQLLDWHAIPIHPVKDMRPTRDVLYAKGRVVTGDTLHVFVVHAPSRMGGESFTRSHRRIVGDILLQTIDSIRLVSTRPRILVMGDFNDYSSDKNILRLVQSGLVEVSANAKGTHGAKATYRFRGEWGSLDHIFLDKSSAALVQECYVHDVPFLLEKDEKYGGVKPRRNYQGPRCLNGFSDHLPLVMRINWQK